MLTENPSRARTCLYRRARSACERIAVRIRLRLLRAIGAQSIQEDTHG